MTGGSVTHARRKTKGSNLAFVVTVKPSGQENVTIAYRSTESCDTESAVCTEDGKALAAGSVVTVTTSVPLTMAVADAEVDEGPGAALAFVVSLSRARDSATTVDYATADGTATAGADYTATSGTLTFAAGETEKTASVAVLDDAHDEGAETLTLTLSGPSPSEVKLADAVATGTIINTDAIPDAWTARFGRTVAGQVLDAVRGRMRSARTAGVELSLGGHGIGWQLGEEAAAGHEAAHLEVQAQRRADWIAGDVWPEAGNSAGRLLTPHEFLVGSSVAVTAEAPGSGAGGGGSVSVWARGAASHLDGRDGELTVDGEVTSGLMGVEWSGGRAMAGLIVGRSGGEGGYRSPEGDGVVSSTLTGVYPWGRYEFFDRVELWGAGGYGIGTLTLTPEQQDAMRTGLNLWMAAAGLRGTLVGGAGFTLAAKTDAMTVTTSTDRVAGLAASQVSVSRLRLALEGALPIPLADGSVLTPSAEIGGRYDLGDAETGFGAEVDGGIAWHDAVGGLSAELSARGLVIHEANGFRDWGVSGALAWEPVAGGRGPRLSLTQTVSGGSTGGADELLERATLVGLSSGGDAGGDLASRRTEARFGYGVAAFSGGYTLTPEAGFGMSDTGRDYSLGLRLTPAATDGARALELGLEATRSEAAHADRGAAHTVTLGGSLHW